MNSRGTMTPKSCIYIVCRATYLGAIAISISILVRDRPSERESERESERRHLNKYPGERQSERARERAGNIWARSPPQ